ncbi:MAG: glycosyltransferase family A protein [Rhodovarius sp.]|nr:glycosyltransferase family 2 protein [Rhodovarius sp.]MDW8314998.1 glycosyltransferase family A protein [Rhodovarius sp.]
MIRFSLIVATIGRAAELRALFDSLIAQGWPALEVIVVDQNEDARLAPVIADYAARLEIRHVRRREAHANAARNQGLALARGDVVGFPDDDCTLPPGVLARVAHAFTEDPELAVLTGPAATPEGALGSGRWRRESGPITTANVWTSVIEFNLWLRREVAVALGGFDEGMGPGTRFGSAEGNDLVCRAIAAGHVARYDYDLRVVHPDKRLTDVAAARARAYGRGLGFALRRHAPARAALPFFLRPVGGVVVSLLQGRLRHAAYYANTWLGRVEGFLAGGRA